AVDRLVGLDQLGHLAPGAERLPVPPVAAPDAGVGLDQLPYAGRVQELGVQDVDRAVQDDLPVDVEGYRAIQEDLAAIQGQLLEVSLDIRTEIVADTAVGRTGEVGPDEAVRLFRLDRPEAVPGVIDRVEELLVGHVAQFAAVASVGPAVIAAHEHPLAAARLVLHPAAAVTAHVDVAADRRVAAADDDQRDAEYLGGHEVARLGDLGSAGHDERHLPDRLALDGGALLADEMGDRHLKVRRGQIGRVVAQMVGQPGRYFLVKHAHSSLTPDSPNYETMRHRLSSVLQIGCRSNPNHQAGQGRHEWLL